MTDLDLIPIEYGQAPTAQATKKQLRPFWHDIFVGLTAGLFVLAFSCTDMLTTAMLLCILVIVVWTADGFWTNE